MYFDIPTFGHQRNKYSINNDKKPYPPLISNLHL